MINHFKKSEMNKTKGLIGCKTKEPLNTALTFVLLAVLTKDYMKYNRYTNFTHRDITEKVNHLFGHLLGNTNPYLKARIELYKLRQYEVIKFVPLKKKYTYSIKATDRANELLLYIHTLFEKKYFYNEFKDNFYRARIRQKDNDIRRIEINFTNKDGVLNYDFNKLFY